MEKTENIKLGEIKAKLKAAFIGNDNSLLTDLFEDYYDADIVEALEDTEELDHAFKMFEFFDSKYQAKLFELLSSELKEIVIENLSLKSLGELFEKVPSDEIVEILEDVDDSSAKKVLKAISKESRDDINEILKHADDSVGSIMSVDFIALNEDWTVKRCIEEIENNLDSLKDVEEFYVVNDYNVLVGRLEAKTLLFNKSTKNLKDIMDDRVMSLKTTQDQEEVVEMFRRYEFINMPVVDNEEILVGIVTVDDVLDVIEEEVTEDIYKLGGVTPSEDEYFKTGIFVLFRHRVMTIITVAIVSVLTSLLLLWVITANDSDTLKNNPAVFYGITGSSIYLSVIPLIFMQSSVITNRGISLKEIQKRDTLHVIGKEMTISLMNCLMLMGLAIIHSLIVELIFNTSGITEVLIDTVIITTGMFAAIFLVTLLATLIPLWTLKTQGREVAIPMPIAIAVIEIMTAAILVGFITIVTQVL
ncbi:Mg2+ transport protein [Spiroplasma sp. TIUS-1]|uniref:magnesium transporter n=1 Tax=Spiroplasma sp. TIUS-1 TaxID=216963 RepID=UPI0013986A14|nr:CBS domain-containing protein [Spiroplasma sp. TIUS-1]QHX35634.1 Mg2+ transport protein [Spiroplasma sp. TIUS-1]